MSLGALTSLAAVRDQRPPTKQDLGKSTAPEMVGQPASLTDILLSQVPTELVAPYTLVSAAIVGAVGQPSKAMPNPDQLATLRWLAFGILIVATAALVWEGKRRKAQGGPFPLLEVTGAVIAATGWAFALPGSPLIPYVHGALLTITPLIAAFAAIACSAFIASALQGPRGRIRVARTLEPPVREAAPVLAAAGNANMSQVISERAKGENMTIGKLHVQSDGRLNGPASLSYNVPFPCVNGSYGSGAMMGVVMHTMVGNLPGTISVFNKPSYQASAHFGIAQDGHIHQFGPIGKGWIAWAQEAGNQAWYSIEHADNANPNNPLTDAQMTASAQVVECLSAFAGFPLQISDDVNAKGYGVHNMGGAAWGGHTCPDLPPHHVRSAQRAEILRRAAAIRSPVTGQSGKYVADGTKSLADVAASSGRLLENIVWLTAVQHPGGFGPLEAKYFNAGDLHAVMPVGMVYWLPGY
ncbi:MAG TPA: N-acetylmuramoyl-L-alanine amidase [Gemmataceae bacterium]|nr:N-acetylmuramoyl-L-alanine amidase [Gemmataceae bacterium]